MKRKNFTLLLLLALLCSTLPAGALRVKTENVAPGSRHDFKWVQGKQEISEFSTGVPYFRRPMTGYPGGALHTRISHSSGTYLDMPDWVICYKVEHYIWGYVNGGKKRKHLPDYAQITQVNIPVLSVNYLNKDLKNTMNVKTYVKTFFSDYKTYRNSSLDEGFFDFSVSCNRDSLINRMGRAKLGTYVSGAGHEKHSGFRSLSRDMDSAYWMRPVDEHPEDFIRGNLSTPYTWAYDDRSLYNSLYSGVMFMWDIRDAHDVHLDLPVREEALYRNQPHIWYNFFDRALYAGKGKGVLNGTDYAPLLATVGFRDQYACIPDYGDDDEPYDEDKECPGWSEYRIRLGGEKAIGGYDNTTNDIPGFHSNRELWDSPALYASGLSFVMKYYTNDLRGKVLNNDNDSTPIVDRVTEDQPSGRPLVRLYDVTAQRYITPDGKTLNAHGSFEVEADGSFEFPALNPSHRYQLSFASYSYGYYEINDIFFDPDKDSQNAQPTSRAVIPFTDNHTADERGYFDQREPGKPYDLEMTLLLNKNSDVTTGVANPGTGREVSRVRYFNMQGCESPQPHSGVNVVVTEYSDGGKSTAKKVIP